MYTPQGYQHYRNMQVQTADSGELVVMLYQGAIRFLVRASAALKTGDLVDGHNNVVRGQEIIAELMGSLDMNAGEIARNLFRIYEYMHYRLVQANVSKDPQPIDEVTQLLRELLPAWQQAAREVRAADTDSRAVAVGTLSYAVG